MIVYDKEQKQIVIPNGLGNVNIIINGGECPGCNIGEGEYNFNANNVGTYELNASDDGYDGWSKMFINIDGGAIKVWRASDLLNEFNTNINVLEFGRNYYVGGKITDIAYVNTQYGDAKYTLDNGFLVYKGKWIDGNGFSSEDQIKVGAYIVVYGVLKDYNGQLELDRDSQVIAYQECTGSEGGGCNLGDLVKEITENGNYVYYPSDDGLDGYKIADIRINVPQEGGGCKLITRTIKENGTYRASDGYNIPVINLSQNGAFDSKLKVDVINTYIEFYFAFKDERPSLISFYGCEESDWQDTTFAARFYENSIEVKIGSFVRMFNVDEYGLVDGNAHKMKVGRTYGIEIDGQMVTTSSEIENGIVFTPSETRTLYIGAINSPGIEDNGLNLFWRPFNGFIGAVAIYGRREDGEQVLYNYQPGDYGWWGDYKIVETDQRVENINREPGATPLDNKMYNPNANGYSEVTVDMPLKEFNYTNNNDDNVYREAYWDGVAGYNRINIDNKPYGENKKNEGKQLIQNNLKELNVNATGVGTVVYEAKMEDVNFGSLRFNNGQRFLSNYQPILNTSYVEQNGFEIIIKAKLVSGEDSGGILIGTAMENNFEGNTKSTIILRTNMDATRLWIGEGSTYNTPTRLNEWVTYRIAIDGLYISSESNPVEEHIGWEVEPNINSQSWDAKVAIGGLNTYYDGLSSDYRYSGRIAKVEFKQAETFTYVPTESGLFSQTETSTELQTVDGVPAEYTTGTEKVGEYGWKKVTIKKEYATANDVLGIWYENSGIKSENEQINSDWDQALQGETIQNVFPGIAFTISGQAVAKPFFIDRVNRDSTATRIGKLVSTAYGTPVSCAIVVIGAFDCKNIQEVDLEAFKYMTDLLYIDGMNGLGESFTSPQTIDFTYCTNLFNKNYTEKFIPNFAESLFNLSAGNKNGINTSTLKFKNAVQERSQNADAIALMRSKGWTVEFV